MYFDRKALKAVTKRMVNQGQPKGFLVTLVYMLATVGVANVVGYLTGLLMAGPMEAVMEAYYSYFDAMMYGEVVSQSTMNALLQQMTAALGNTWVLVALLITLIMAFYTMVVQFGYSNFALRRVRGQQECEYRDLFDWFYMAGKIIWLNILMLIFIFLWALLFYFPGIVAAYRYRMAIYCLLDDPDISALEAIRRSKKLMRGNKGHLFVLDLSFLGWSILASMGLSAVVGATVLLPGIVMTVINLAAECAILMHLNTYVAFTDAGFYLFTLRGGDAPPVAAPPVDPQPPQDLPPADEGWMK